MNDKNVESTKWLKVIVHASPFFAPYLIPVLFYLFVDDASVKKISIQALLFQILMGVLIFISAIFSALLIVKPCCGMVFLYRNERIGFTHFMSQIFVIEF